MKKYPTQNSNVLFIMTQFHEFLLFFAYFLNHYFDLNVFTKKSSVFTIAFTQRNLMAFDKLFARKINFFFKMLQVHNN